MEGGQAPRQTVHIAGKRRRVRLDRVTWDCLVKMAERQGRTIHDIATEVDRRRRELSLTAALRVFVVDYYLGQMQIALTAPHNAGVFAMMAALVSATAPFASRVILDLIGDLIPKDLIPKVRSGAPRASVAAISMW